MEPISISLIISVLSLSIAIFTLWRTRFHVGSVKMTRPTIICFVPTNDSDNPKIFIRMLLYSTSDKGQYVQNMYVRLQRGESTQNFNIWAYQDSSMVRGSGLFLNKSGVSLSHHFLLPKDELNYKFLAGEYKLEVFVETVGEKVIMIFQQRLSLSKEQQEALANNKSIYFDWAPNTQNYFSNIEGQSNGRDKETGEMLLNYFRK
jgi:hypothetical protein